MCACVCVCVCVYACMCVCVCGCMHVCVNVVELLLCFVLEVGLYVYSNSRTLSWMQSNELKLNTEKTEMMLIGSSVHISSVDCESANIGGSSIPFQTIVAYLGVHLVNETTHQ